MQGLPYPTIDPILVHIGPFPIRWYALAYLFGIILGYMYMRSILQNQSLWTPRTTGILEEQKKPHTDILEDMLFWSVLGVVFGGRLGFVLFYNTSILWDNPLEVFKVWHGGMSFHGGLIGVMLAVYFVAKAHKVPVLRLADALAPAVPIGLFLGRLANFINGELYGRPADIPWGMVFPGDPEGVLRHPSQLYEAGLEGLLLFFLLFWAVRVWRSLTRPGLTTGLFFLGYGLSRGFVEFFRQPDPQMPDILQGDPLTMGMLLCLPLIFGGTFLLVRAVNHPQVRPSDSKSVKTTHRKRGKTPA